MADDQGILLSVRKLAKTYTKFRLKEISFDQAYKAAGISSGSGDYFPPEKAVLVEMN